MRDRKKRNITIISLCCLLVFMAVGYALLKQVLNINGTASITGGWKIRISDISVHEVIGTATNIEEKLTYTDSEATFGVNLVKPGDKIIYKVTVVNEGSIDAVLSIDSTTTSHKDIKFMNTLASGEILYGSGSANGTTKLSEKEFYVTAEFSESATDVISGEISEYKIQLTYTQYDGNSLYEPPKDVETDNGVFQVSADGTILKYNADLGTSVSIPAEVDGIPITSIASDAFKDVTIKYNYDYKAVLDLSTGAPAYGVIFNAKEEDAIRQQVADANINVPIYIVGDSGIPELVDGQIEGYFYLETGVNSPILSTSSEFLGETSVERKLLIKSLDLSNATNLETIERFAFSNFEIGMTEEEIDNLETGLTSLTFGNNKKEMFFGVSAFAGAKLDTLKIYASATSNKLSSESYEYLVENGYEDNSLMKLMSSFSRSEINNLIIEATPTSTVVSPVVPDTINELVFASVFMLAKRIDSLYIGEGITEIPLNFVNMVPVKKVVLPNTLTKIGVSAFANTGLTNINIPKSVVEIGDFAFDDNDLLTITMLGRKNLDGMILTDNWCGNATVKFAG